MRTKLAELNQEVRILKILLDPKQEPPVNILDDLRQWLKDNQVEECEFILYVKEQRASKSDEDLWLLNEMIRESEAEGKISKRYGTMPDTAEVGPELIRVPELLFRPKGLIRFEQCGLGESIENVTSKFADIGLLEVRYCHFGSRYSTTNPSLA